MRAPNARPDEGRALFFYVLHSCKSNTHPTRVILDIFDL